MRNEDLLDVRPAAGDTEVILDPTDINQPEVVVMSEDEEARRDFYRSIAKLAVGGAFRGNDNK